MKGFTIGLPINILVIVAIAVLAAYYYGRTNEAACKALCACPEI